MDDDLEFDTDDAAGADPVSAADDAVAPDLGPPPMEDAPARPGVGWGRRSPAAPRRRVRRRARCGPASSTEHRC